MSEPEGSNNPTDIPRPIDSAPTPHSEPGTSASAAQAPGAQAPLPTGATPQASAAQPAKTVFGMRQDAKHYQPLQNVVFNDDYEHRFPEDPYGQETAPNARIWRVYNEEAAAYDVIYVGQARDGLDVMLVFAGLFSAVVTSFLVQVSQSLQADYTSMSAILLYDLVSVQLSIAEGSLSRPNITVPSVNPLQTFRPDSITVWVNGLWVVSLVMSLVVALSAVLVKQWFHHYTSIPSGTPATRSHLRQYRFDGIQKWRVNIIVGLLPIIMHISLVLFLVGLVLFFIPLRTSLACAVGVITVVLCLLYLISSAMPIFFPQCPYQTPLTDFIYHILYYLHLDIMFSYVCSWQRVQDPFKTLNQVETDVVESEADKLSVDVLEWLFNHLSNPTVHSLAVQAIGGLPPDVQEHYAVTWKGHRGIGDICYSLLCSLESQDSQLPCTSLVRARVLRLSHLFLVNISSQVNAESDDPHFLAAIKWVATQDWWEPGRKLQNFFCTYHKLEFHPFIWDALVRQALQVQSCCFRVDSLEDLSSPNYAHIISLFLPASIKTQIPIWRGMAPTTLDEALTSPFDDISESVQHCLLDMLSPFKDDLPATLPPHYHILYKAGQFALRYLPDDFWTLYQDGGSSRQLELLLVVLQSLQKEYDTILAKHSCFMGPILKLLRAIIDDTSFCDYTAADLQEPKLHALLDDSLSAISCLMTGIVSSHQPGFIFPSFHRLLQAVSAHDSAKTQHLNMPSFCGARDLMETVLIIGHEEMYRAFIDGGWLWLLAERHIADPIYCYHQPVVAFIRGLQALDFALALEFLDYLQQPKNFIITLITIALSEWHSDRELLLALCPKDSSSWDTHRPTLNGFIDWCQASNRTDLPFPFENFFDGKVVQTFKGSVSLDEALQEFLAEERHMWRVKWAARTIIRLHGTKGLQHGAV